MLIVRSQDKKKLIKVTRLYVIEFDKWTIVNVNFMMDEEIGNADYDTLGEYETEERALAVLDEIQKFVGNYEDSRAWNNIVGRPNTNADFNSFDPVFEMPEK